MQDNNTIVKKIKEQIEYFSDKLTVGMYKTRKRFVREMLFGIQAARDIKLSNISRSLNEDIQLIKTENRLSRQISKEDFTERINKILIEEGAKRIKEDTVLALDLSDINKHFAKKMENLGEVWDGSEGKVDNGYWICEVIGAEVESDSVVPLYSSIFSSEAKDFVSENKEILKAIKGISEATERKGIFVMDRGADRIEIIEKTEEMKVRFVIRMTSRRDIKTKNGRVMNILSYAQIMQCNEEYTISVDNEGVMEKKKISLGSGEVKIGKMKFTLVVIKGFGVQPMMLLTNAAKSNREVLEIYLTRWKCEEGFRFLKQEYHLEDVRVRSYIGIKNTMILLQAVFYFISIIIGKKMKINILLKKILEKANRFFEEPVFKQYAIADGIYRLLFNTSFNGTSKKRVLDDRQAMFDFALGI